MSRLPSRASKSSVAFDSKVYLNHLMGLTALLAWKARWDRTSSAVAFKGPVLSAQLLPSQRFAFGFPTAKSLYGRTPFLAVQRDEAQFIKRLQWSRAWLDHEKQQLVLVTQKVLGDGDHLEDLPAMGLALTVDVPQKLEWLSKHPRLEARSLWFDEDGHHVSAGLPLAKWSLRRLEGTDSLFPEGALSQERSLRELIEDKLSKTNRMYLPYQGSALSVPSDFQDLVSPFQADRVQKVRPTD